MAMRLKCNYCGNLLYGEGHLRRHLRMVHKSEQD